MNHRRTLFAGLTALLVVAATAMALPRPSDAYDSGRLTPGNPLAGYPWFVDTERGTWWVALRDHPAAAAGLRRAAYNPMGKTFGSWMDQPRLYVRDYIARSQRLQPGSIPFLNLARMESPSCPYPPTPAGFSERDVDSWVKGFSDGIGKSRVAVILETDKLTTIRCLPKWAQDRRFREFRYEVHTLHTRNPNAIVYIEAGAADWGKGPATIANWLKRAGVAEAQGFALNTSHYSWTDDEVRFGLRISDFLRGKHFVVNTSDNGWGPRPRGSSWYSPYYHKGCTPPGAGLGMQPTVDTHNRRVDAFIWSGTPGFEDGNCLGYGPAYQFYLRLALSLVENANPGL